MSVLWHDDEEPVRVLTDAEIDRLYARRFLRPAIVRAERTIITWRGLRRRKPLVLRIAESTERHWPVWLAAWLAVMLAVVLLRSLPRPQPAPTLAREEVRP